MSDIPTGPASDANPASGASSHGDDGQPPPPRSAGTPGPPPPPPTSPPVAPHPPSGPAGASPNTWGSPTTHGVMEGAGRSATDPLDPSQIVSLRGLTKVYGRTVAAADVSFDVPRGSLLGLVGPNGSGKTTTMSVIVGLLRPTSGQVSVCGHDPTRDSTEVRRRVGYMPDILGFHDRLTVTEYIDFFAAAHRIPASRRGPLVDGLLELVDLTERADSRVDALSRGLKQRVSLARCLVHDPELLVLDEPASGLDPRARVELRETLEHLRELGKTIIVSSHILGELESMCTDLAIISNGRVVASGPAQDLLRRATGERQIRVRLAGGETRDYTAADEAAQAQLVRRLVVDEGLNVIEVNSTTSGLERLFLDVTVASQVQPEGP